MAEFERAFTISDVDRFIGARLEKLRLVSTKIAARGDKYFLARQHAYFLHAYGDCKCHGHSCSGCAITLGVASKLEGDIAQLDPLRVDQEEAKASAGWTRVWSEWREFVRIVTVRHVRLKAEREGRTERVRRASVHAARETEKD